MTITASSAVASSEERDNCLLLPSKGAGDIMGLLHLVPAILLVQCEGAKVRLFIANTEGKLLERQCCYLTLLLPLPLSHSPFRRNQHWGFQDPITFS